MHGKTLPVSSDGSREGERGAGRNERGVARPAGRVEIWLMRTRPVVIAMFVAGSAFAQSTPPALDAIAKKIIAREQVVGASVLVSRGGKVLLHKGYGLAELNLQVPAKDETVYHVVGPLMPFTGVAVMQLVESRQTLARRRHRPARTGFSDQRAPHHCSRTAQPHDRHRRLSLPRRRDRRHEQNAEIAARSHRAFFESSVGE